MAERGIALCPTLSFFHTVANDGAAAGVPLEYVEKANAQILALTAAPPPAELAAPKQPEPPPFLFEERPGGEDEATQQKAEAVRQKAMEAYQADAAQDLHRATFVHEALLDVLDDDQVRCHCYS